MIVECNVWCVGNDPKLIDMGLPEGDSWMPIAIDFRRVIAIKLAGPHEFVGDDKATIHLEHGLCFTTDIPYRNAVTIWHGCE